ncbi:hypothetical protein [Ensifer sp. ENS10]|uniref:hypothetical protein n=1 Tax=Ensifer sp. ENS10 TaxID=2769286 RepID=UPI001FEE423F|nr:hypothetical protein [Ensifer sp. ENS10]
MALKLVLDSLDNVDEALKPIYVAHSDGKFHLDTDADSVRGHRDVLPLANAYERTKTDLATVKGELADAKKKAAPDDFDAETWKKLKDGKTDDAAHQRQLVELRKTLEGERDDWKGKFEGEVTKGKKAKINAELTDALSASGITNPSFVKAARALLEPRVAMDTDDASMDIGLGPMGIAEAVKRWAAGDEGKSFVAPAKGDNAKGNDGGHQQQTTKGDFGGDTKARTAAIAAKFPELEA